jgi:hypothetical protein
MLYAHQFQVSQITFFRNSPTSILYSFRFLHSGYMSNPSDTPFTVVITNHIIEVIDSSVDIATRYRMDDWGSIPGRGKRFFSLQQPQRIWSQSSIQWVPGALPLGGKTDLSPLLVPGSTMVELYLTSHTSSWRHVE